MGKRKKKQAIDFGVYLITDRKQLANSDNSELATRKLISAVRQALKGGVRAVQLREKDLGTRDVLRLGYRLREVTKRYNARLFINDRFDIALAVEADGVHLTGGGIPADVVRRTVGEGLMIGVSTHSLNEARAAERSGADFVTFGPVYRTPSKMRYGRPVGLTSLEEVCCKVSIPVFAIGGIKVNRVPSVFRRGAAGVALISGILGEEDIRSGAYKFVSAVNEFEACVWS
jgi:thiamine-phosphate pyrophosphorylase